MSCGVNRRHGSDPAWLWRRLAAAAPVQPLAWELPYAASVALKSRKEKKKCWLFYCSERATVWIFFFFFSLFFTCMCLYPCYFHLTLCCGYCPVCLTVLEMFMFKGCILFLFVDMVGLYNIVLIFGLGFFLSFSMVNNGWV